VSITILAIESSCDETAAAICRDGVILSNFIANQTIHEQYGGVVPELASRAHMQNIVPVVQAALQKAALSANTGEDGIPVQVPSGPQEFTIAQHSTSTFTKAPADKATQEMLQSVSAIAFTQAPGLIGSLLVGAQFAKSLALALNVPLIAVHHMQAHVLANLIEDPQPEFPFLCLTVSGGHTQIVLCESPQSLKVIGETMDDAAGEAFDKSAKLLGLPYPGGPLIDKYAQTGNPNRFKFPEPQITGLNFSFSGLKTAILYFLQENTAANPRFIEENLADICASIQHRIVSILLNKLKSAALTTGIDQLCIAGGVSANSGLRKAFTELGQKNNWQTFIPAFQYCTDNAAMIALTGYFKYLNGEFVDLGTSPTARAEW
jgi:N6-L-threonylcarbamoyladenine synthase